MLHDSDDDQSFDADVEQQKFENNQVVPTIVYVPTAVPLETTEETEEKVEGTYSKKYHDAARFWKVRPYFAKHWGMT